MTPCLPQNGPRVKPAVDSALAPHYNRHIGAWRSLVAHLLWEQRVGCSNHPAPTNRTNRLMMPSAMRRLTGNLEWLSLNTATVREQWDLRQAADGCVRHGIPGIAPWRDQVQALGPEQAGGLIRDHGLAVSGYCRGGLFTAPDAAGRQAAIDDNFRAIDEAAAIGAQCLIILGG